MVFRPIVTCTSELWTLNIAQRNRIRAWERKVPRKIYGGKSVNGMWTRRTNQEVRELYGEPDIVTVIKSHSSDGHVERMSKDRLPKMAKRGTIGGRKRRGRP